MTLTSLQKDTIRTILRANGALIGYVFGSYARGTAGTLSDLDLGVVFPDSLSFEIQENQIERMRYSLEKTYGRDLVDIINIGKIKNPLLRYLIVLGEGILLYDDNVSIRNQIAARSLRDFEDTQHLRNIQGVAIRHLFA